MIRITYDPEADAMMFFLNDSKAASSREIVPARLIVRFDDQHNPISFALRDVSDDVDES